MNSQGPETEHSHMQLLFLIPLMDFIIVIIIIIMIKIYIDLSPFIQPRDASQTAWAGRWPHSCCSSEKQILYDKTAATESRLLIRILRLNWLQLKEQVLVIGQFWIITATLFSINRFLWAYLHKSIVWSHWKSPSFVSTNPLILPPSPSRSISLRECV